MWLASGLPDDWLERESHEAVVAKVGYIASILQHLKDMKVQEARSLERDMRHAVDSVANDRFQSGLSDKAVEPDFYGACFSFTPSPAKACAFLGL